LRGDATGASIGAMIPTLIALAVQAAATAAPPSPAQIAQAAPTADWRAIPPEELLVMTLGDGRQVVIQLASEFSPRHFDAIRRIAAARWWNEGASINRVQDNYVVQWGAADEKKPLPAGIADNLPAEYDAPAVKMLGVRKRDAYAATTGFSASGWPVASDGKRAWIPHCYGYVGVGRDLKPSTGSGAELYAVIGHAPRHLDRNIVVAGRVLSGIEYLSSLPRGTGALGFYEDAKQRVPIRSITLGSHLPAAEQPRWQYLAPGSASFERYQRARENREPPFFERAAGGADVCNVPVPVRKAP
jgi:peptidylprolyl isomerase